jgi:hypothetical protein
MLKAIILSVLITQGLLIAGDCQYYGAQSQYYEKKAIAIAKKQPMDWCGAADALEQVVNNMDSTRKSCAGGEALRPTINSYMASLAQATIKCGH